jgi:hypothetical protein
MTMIRLFSMLFIATAIALTSIGCDKKPQQPRQEPPAETDTEKAQPGADAAESVKAEPDTEQADTEQGDDKPEQAIDCPEARDYQGMCAQVITWARDPQTGYCCQYSSPCETPEDWQTYTSETDCAQAGGQTGVTPQ